MREEVIAMGLKILFVGTACPFGEISGAGLRTLNLIRLLERIGEVTVVFATGRDWTMEQEEQTRAAFKVALISRYIETPVDSLRDRYRKIFDPSFMNTNGVIAPPADARQLDELIANHDVVWLHTLKLANAFRRDHWPKSVMDVDDYPSRFHQSAAGQEPTWRGRLLRQQKAFSWRRHEARCLERFDVLTVCKPADVAHFGDPQRVRVVPNGFSVDGSESFTYPPPALRIGMIGDFNYLPNHDGLRWFIREVWPKLKGRFPTVTLRLVGKGSAEIAGKFEDQGVEGLGYVSDVAQEIGSWSLMIVPTRLGGGTHLKVAEGLARGVPIVTTSHGARGYDLIPEVHAFVTDGVDEFIRGCSAILENPAVGQRLRQSGLELFRERFSWDSIHPAVEQVVAACLSRQRR